VDVNIRSAAFSILIFNTRHYYKTIVLSKLLIIILDFERALSFILTAMETLTVREASELTGLSAHTLRYYERIGLIEPVARNSV
jgi:hypothetical protein